MPFKLTKIQKYWLIMIMIANPMFIAGAMSAITKHYNEIFTNEGYFLMGLYVILWIIILVSYLIKKDKWVKEYNPRSTEQIIDDVWKDYRKEKEVEKK